MNKTLPDTFNPIRNVTTGKIYRNVYYAMEDLGISESHLYRCMRNGKEVNGFRLEKIEVQARKQAQDERFGYVMFKSINLPPDLEVGDFVLMKDDRVLIYGSLESVASRCTLSKENIYKLCKTSSRTSHGLRGLYIETEWQLEQLMGMKKHEIEEARKSALKKNGGNKNG